MFCFCYLSQLIAKLKSKRKHRQGNVVNKMEISLASLGIGLDETESTDKKVCLYTVCGCYWLQSPPPLHVGSNECRWCSFSLLPQLHDACTTLSYLSHTIIEWMLNGRCLYCTCMYYTVCVHTVLVCVH